jgi:hypothetical protein
MDTALHKPTATAAETDWPLVLRLRPAVNLSEDEFFEMCQLNRDLRIERNAEGELLLMPPTGGGTGNRNSEINWQLVSWAKRDGTGVCFDSSTGFQLPNTAVRSPDASWLPKSRYEQIPADQQEKFVPACPGFVLELRSPSDRLSVVRDKMGSTWPTGHGWAGCSTRGRVTPTSTARTRPSSGSTTPSGSRAIQSCPASSSTCARSGSVRPERRYGTLV